MADPFSPIDINGMRLANRFMRSATYDGMARKGRATPAQASLYAALARGGTGLVVSGLMAVSPEGGFSPLQNFIHDDSFIPDLAEICQAVHAAGGKVAAQLAHGGRESRPLSKGQNEPPAAPSAGQGETGPYRALGEHEVRRIIADFGAAAGRAKRAGFDAVQLHAAHAYLPAQFLSPLSNQRTDQWGGSPANRLRFHLEVLAAMRAAVGPDYPLMIKLGLADGAPGGLSEQEGLDAARALAGAGFDSLEISQGLRGPTYDQTEFRTKLKPETENYFAAWAGWVKDQVEVPVAMVGGLRGFEAISRLLQNGAADLAALSRPLIREPGLVSLWREHPEQKAACVSCNKCLLLVQNGRPLACALQDREAAAYLKEKAKK